MSSPTADYLIELRKRTGLSAKDMADAMGMPYRTYQAIELKQNPTRPIHIQAAKMALIELAALRRDTSFLPESLLSTVMDVASTANEKPPS